MSSWVIYKVIIHRIFLPIDALPISCAICTEFLSIVVSHKVAAAVWECNRFTPSNPVHVWQLVRLHQPPIPFGLLPNQRLQP
jgi:hypothetical protein